MNSIKSYTTFFLLLTFFTYLSQAQDKKNDKIAKCTFEVKGVCGMCQDRIQEAAYIKGVKLAEWDRKTGIFTAIYRKDKTSEENIHTAIAAAGHTTAQLKADTEAYGKLPDCCKYDDGVIKH